MAGFRGTLRQVPTAQAALALSTTGIGLAWALFMPGSGDVIRGVCAVLGAALLMPVILKYLLFPRNFLLDLRHPLYGSLMAPMTMTMLVLADYLSSIHLHVARVLWYPAMALHFFMLVYFFFHQIKNFRLINLYPSWFLYPVGAISGTLAGPQLGHTEFALLMTHVCVAIYFMMLPVVLYRLCFAGRLPRPARPTLAIMAAPVNLSLAAYLSNVTQPDPVLTGALAGVAITMTILVYLFYINLLNQRFQPPLAAVTFPSVISAVAIERLTDWLMIDYPHWTWLKSLALIELMVATTLVFWVSWKYIGFYWPQTQRCHPHST
ncbi:TDT family transporter [Photobacterium sp. MCCC 1A19761]|uniref:TDT family transporter n=1 Tax=Photobacterium sp. MCCC 1A19761 TaxID=3115000 RepID=UPI00307F8A1C